MGNAKENKVRNIIISMFILFVFDIFFNQNIFKNENIGVQDIAATLSVVSIGYYQYVTKEIKLNLIYRSMSIYVVYLIFTNFVLLSASQTEFLFIFYILKNIVYFIALVVTYISFQLDSYKSKKIIKISVILISLYGIYLVATNKIAYYGIGTMFEEYPSRSGNIYLVSAIVSFFFYRLEKEKTFFILFITNLFLILMTVSKTNILGAIIFLILFYSITFFLKVLQKDRFKKNKIMFLWFTLLVGIVMVVVIMNMDLSASDNIFVKRIWRRFGVFDSSYDFRRNKGTELLNHFLKDKGLYTILFGRGKGITEIELNATTMGVDNQYVRAIIEVGIVGIILWLNFIYKLYKETLSDRRIFFVSIFVAYLAMGVGYEVFVVTKSGIIFYFIMGMILGYEKNDRLERL